MGSGALSSSTEVRDWQAVRGFLLQVALRHRFAPDVAEDLVQDAMAASLQHTAIAHPVAYALASLHKRMALHRRAAATRARGAPDWLLAAWCAPPVPSIEVISIGAALEHLGAWHGSGRTRQLLLPDANLDRLAAEAAEWWGELIAALDTIPVGERQRRRYRARAAELVADAIASAQASVRLLDPVHDRDRIARIRALAAELPAEPPDELHDEPATSGGPSGSQGDAAEERQSRIVRLVERIRSRA